MIVKLAYLTNIPDSHHIVKKVCNWQENATIEHIFSHVYEMGRIEVKYSTNTTFSVHYFINRRNLQLTHAGRWDLIRTYRNIVQNTADTLQTTSTGKAILLGK